MAPTKRRRRQNHAAQETAALSQQVTFSRVVGVEEGDDEVDEDGEVEGDGSPQRHPPGEPVQHGHT